MEHHTRLEMIPGTDHYIWRTHASQLQSVLHEFVKRLDFNCART